MQTPKICILGQRGEREAGNQDRLAYFIAKKSSRSPITKKKIKAQSCKAHTLNPLPTGGEVIGVKTMSSMASVGKTRMMALRKRSNNALFGGQGYRVGRR